MHRVNARVLDRVTLVAVDTRAPALAAQALRRSMSAVRFARALLLTHEAAASLGGDGLEVIDIGPISSAAAYSQFVLHGLLPFVDTSHVLVTQWDGFVLDATAWDDAFLQHDYIGAVWPEQPAALSVGNGGFSLRSRRLLEATAHLRWSDEHPEDEALCRRHRAEVEALGLRFAPPSLARRFAFENEPPRGPAFGFHGCYHLPRALDETTLGRWLDALPDAFFRGRDARRLAKALLRARMLHTASALVERRRAAGRDDPQTRLLGALARAGTVLGLGRALPQARGT
jgi:hypothetical protein